LELDMTNRFLPLWALLLCVSACDDSGPSSQGSFFGPGTGDDGDDEEMDSGSDPADSDEDGEDDEEGQDAAPVGRDGSIGESDAGPAPEDAAVAVPDGSTHSPDGGATDAGVTPDASTQLDAGSDAGAPDAGAELDASLEDGGAPQPDAAVCGTDGLVAGNSCAGVVTCQDNNFSGDPVLECVLVENGARRSRCCTATFASNSCRSAACGGGDDEALCDGPEDCGAATGTCCFNAGATSCAASCAAAQTLCHTDADCPSGRRCEAGTSSGQYSWWGFCGAP
jgi:hypothetical protein